MPKVTIPEHTAISSLLRLQSHIAEVAIVDGKPLTEREVGQLTGFILNTLLTSLDKSEINKIAKTVKSFHAALSTRET